MTMLSQLCMGIIMNKYQRAMKSIYNLQFEHLISMGAVKSIAHSYTYNEYLFFYINKNDTEKIEQILNLRPNLIKDPLTAHSKTTALNRAAYNGNVELIRLLAEKYQADVNLPSPKGETPLISAIRRNHMKAVKALLELGADPNYIDTNGFRTIDYAILMGLYEISQIIYCELKDKTLSHPEDYKDLAKKYNYRYVDYQVFLKQLSCMIQNDCVSDFLDKKRIMLTDPVIDPRQTWKDWFWRNLDFRDPPMVERSELPEELRPQNRKFGKISHFLGKLTLSPVSQVPRFKKETQSEAMGQYHTKNELHQLQIKTVN